MKKYAVIQYLLEAVEKNYLEGIIFDNIKPSKIMITALISDIRKTKPVIWMIEANMYTRRELQAINVKSYDNNMVIHTFENIEYNLSIKVKN